MGVSYRLPVVSIVGKSNSGKTTLIEKLLAGLIGRGYRVGTIKHDAHSFEVDVPGKDSWRHREAGAAGVVIASSERLFLTRRLERELDLFEIVTEHFQGRDTEGYDQGYDLVLTEGFKRSVAPKIEVQRSARSDALVCDVAKDNLIAIASDTAWKVGVPCFDVDDAEGIVAFIVERFLSGRGSAQ
jgi:molybdopterin-guanine dinucleotide biosynthesis protein MobB